VTGPNNDTPATEPTATPTKPATLADVHTPREAIPDAFAGPRHHPMPVPDAEAHTGRLPGRSAGRTQDEAGLADRDPDLARRRDMSAAHPVHVNRATIGDARSIVALLADAFHNDPVSGWLLPDDRERRRQHMGFFLVFVEHALQHGEVALHFNNGYTGAALWLDTGTTQDVAPDMNRVQEALGDEGFERFMVLDELMHKHHPVGVHHSYLPFIAVSPHWQGQGIGRLLLQTRLAQLDEAGTPAYLEASSERSRNLYARLGFRPLDGVERFTLPDGGPDLWPMWWAPEPHRWPVNSRWNSWLS